MLGTTALTRIAPFQGREDWKTGEAAMIPTSIASDPELARQSIENVHNLPFDKQPMLDWKTVMDPKAAKWRDKVAALVRTRNGKVEG
jgi:hypothetical protein